MRDAGDPGPLKTQDLSRAGRAGRLETLLAILLLAAVGVLGTAALISEPPRGKVPFTVLTVDALHEMWAGAHRVDSTTYEACVKGKFWFFYADGEMRETARSCWK